MVDMKKPRTKDEKLIASEICSIAKLFSAPNSSDRQKDSFMFYEGEAPETGMPDFPETRDPEPDFF